MTPTPMTNAQLLELCEKSATLWATADDEDAPTHEKAAALSCEFELAAAARAELPRLVRENEAQVDGLEAVVDYLEGRTGKDPRLEASEQARQTQHMQAAKYLSQISAWKASCEGAEERLKAAEKKAADWEEIARHISKEKP